jgi:hypothetical protein
LILEALIDLTVKRQGQLIPWPKGQVVEWSNEEGHKLLQRAEDTLRIVEAGAPDQEPQVAQRLMELVPGKVRQVEPQLHPGVKAAPKGKTSMNEQWLNGWRTLADLTSEIEQSDPRLKPLINLLEQADKAFEKGNWEEFQIAASRVKNIVNKGGLNP